jgi:hypothetical protein
MMILTIGATVIYRNRLHRVIDVIGRDVLIFPVELVTENDRRKGALCVKISRITPVSA